MILISNENKAEAAGVFRKVLVVFTEKDKFIFRKCLLFLAVKDKTNSRKSCWFWPRRTKERQESSGCFGFEGYNLFRKV